MLGLILGGALALGGSLLSSKSQSKAAKTAADTSMQVAQQNNALARDIYGQNKNALAPFIARGHVPGDTINGMLGLPGYDTGKSWGLFQNFLENSDFAARAAEGAGRVNSGYAGAGVLQSGAAMKAHERFRQDLQAGYRGEYMNALGNQQGLGLSGASALAGVGQNFVNTISNNNNMAGTAAANAALVRGANNPFANALGMVGGGLFSYGMGR